MSSLRPAPSGRSRGVGAVVSGVAGLAVGLLVLLLLYPGPGVDTLPPVCYSAFGYEVPCGWELSVGGALVAALVATVLVWTVIRPRRARR